MNDCVHCGYCCQTAPCAVAKRIYGPVDQCPGLEQRGDRFFCRIMELPDGLGASYREELAAGAGCCSQLNDRRQRIIHGIVEEQRAAEPATGPRRLPPELVEFIVGLAGGFGSTDQVWLAGKYAERKFGPGFAEACVHVLHEWRTAGQAAFSG